MGENEAGNGGNGEPEKSEPKWRRDFPLEASEESYVARRDFVKFLVLTSGAFTAGQVWIGVDHLLRRKRNRVARRAIAGTEELAVGEARQFTYPTEKDPCLLVRTDEDTWHAYSQTCTHLACAVQPEPEQGKLRCPCHNGWFDMETGRVLAGPPRRPLPRVELEVRDGTVYATGMERRT